MTTAVLTVAAQAHSRLRALLRIQRFYSQADLVFFYKAQVLSYIEFATPAVYHAHSFLLQSLDKVQEALLDALDLTPPAALHDFRLAPLESRRDMAMLGLIHRSVLGIAPPQFHTYIRPASGPSMLRSLRSPELRHNRQLHDPIDGSQGRMVQESLLGLIYTYNLLPQKVVDAKCVSSFQRGLQLALTQYSSVTGWPKLFTTGFRKQSVADFQALFDR